MNETVLKLNCLNFIKTIEQKKLATKSTNNIIFFDGECILCNAFIDYMIRHDKQDRLKFASLQGDTAQSQLSAEVLRELKTIIFLSDNQVFQESTAAIRSFATIGGIHKLVLVFLIIPSFIRNIFYRIISKNRYSWFGKQSCRVPTVEEREKILP